MTVGLPRSGKTTWAREQGLPIVNPDSIRLAIHGQPFIAQAEPFVWATAKAMVRALFLAGHDAVILDATNTTAKRRDDWISRSWRREFVIFGQPEEVREICRTRCQAIEDAQRREGLLGAIERMAEQWEGITSGELQEWEPTAVRRQSPWQ